jgi:hypothetical protein
VKSISPPSTVAGLSFNYDQRGLPADGTDPDRGTSLYGYNVLGELTGYETAKGDRDSVVYDVLGRDSLLIRTNGVTSYTYYQSGNGKGKVYIIAGPTGYKKFSYDIYGNVTRECDSISSTKKNISETIYCYKSFIIFVQNESIMTVSDLKIKIFRHIDSLEKSKLEEFYRILLNYINEQKNESDWDNLTIDQKNGILEAIDEIESGKGIPNKTVLTKFRKKYSNV